MIGRADIEGSKSNVAMNAFLTPLASNFRRSKGSIGHAFTVRIRTENQNQTSFYPFVPHEISVLVELILRHLLGFPLSVPVLSLLFDTRGKIPKEPFPVHPPADTRQSALATLEPHAAPPTVNGFRTGTPKPSPQSQSFSQSYGSIFPNSLAYIVPSTRGCSPWRPNAVMSTTGREWHSVLRIFKGRQECTRHHATCGAFPAAGPYLRLSRFQGGQAVKQKR
ncbi:unnamed protein product [Brassica rapa subsp. narinosa]